MRDREITLTEWRDGWLWTVFDADPDYEGGQIEGAVVPRAIAEKREPSQVKALRRALIEAVRVPGGCGEARVTVSLATAAAWAVVCEIDHVDRDLTTETGETT
jgi:hypothetical protein